MTRVMNFNAGPSALPLAALERARDELLDFEGSGMSIMEQSHRGEVYAGVHEEATALLASLLGTPLDEWDVLFLQGGASMAFAQIPMNFLGHGATADYVVTGTWGEKALAEAGTMRGIGGGEARLAGSAQRDDGGYVRVPRQDELSLTEGAAYVHVTSNETIQGVEYALDASAPLPRAEAPVVVDMSSDILGKVVDLSPFDVVYAGAQKNIGPSGVTVVLLKKEMTARGRTDIPPMFQYRTAAASQSLHNTPPTFGVYLIRNTLRWLRDEGGASAMEARNRKKARALYEAIDGSGGFYSCPVAPACRSIMNVVFRLPTPELEDRFVAEAARANMVGLRGHRSVGGCRASIYNAVEPAWCDALASFMKEFARQNG